MTALRAKKGGGRPFGWHSGSMTCKDAYILGDLTIQDDIIFGDCSAGKLAVTGGIDMQATTSAIGIDMGGTFSTTAINIDGTTPIGINIEMTDAVGGYEGILVTNTFTKIGAAAHKAISVALTYTPSATGAACPIGMASKVVLDGGMTYNAASGNYTGYAWGIQGQIDVTDESTFAGKTSTDPGMVLAGVRAVVTSTGSSNTWTNGTLTSLYCENQMKENATAGDFRVFLAWLRFQGTTDSTAVVDAALYIDSGDAWGNNITTGIDINDSVTGIDIGACTTGIDFTGTIANVGIDMTDIDVNSSDDDLSLFRMGGYDTSNAFAAKITANTFGASFHLESIANPDTSKWLAATYNKLTISTADQGNLSAVTVMIRADVAKPMAAFYGIQSHVKFSGTGDTSSEVIGVSAQIYGTHAGAGYHWGVKSDLRHAGCPSGAGHLSACFFGVGTVDISCGVYIEALSTKTIHSGIYLHGAGTITNAIELAGTITNVFDFAEEDGSQGATTATGAVGSNTHKIAIDVAGTTRYLVAYDGVAAS